MRNVLAVSTSVVACAALAAGAFGGPVSAQTFAPRDASITADATADATTDATVDRATDAATDATADRATDATADARPDARGDTGVRCIPIDPDEIVEADEPVRHDAGPSDAATDAAVECRAPRVFVDRAEHCCLPGQSWAGGRCAGAPASCAPGDVVDRAANECVRRRAEAGDAGPTAHLDETPSTQAPAGMVRVPGATFRFGGQWVSVAPYAIERAEVTAAAYDRCVAAGVCAALPDPYGQMSARAVAPAVNVTWSMALRYCGWAGMRLPTEAEWELAARGLDGRRYPWGERAPECSLARFAGCGDAPLRVGALPAGASPFGLRDMAGNVAEWTWDAYGPRTPRDDARVTADPGGAASGATRVVRGGSFVSSPTELASESRRAVDAREARNDVGFRCARGL